MRNLRATKVAWLAAFATSFLSINNCSDHSDATSEENLAVESASDNYTNGISVAGYPGVGLGLYPGLAGDLPLIGAYEFMKPPLVGPFPFPIETHCEDGVDNNGNGLTDCEDPNCQVRSECSEWGPPAEELKDGDALVIYPSGAIAQEKYVIRNQRNTDDDDLKYGYNDNGFFAERPSDCWIQPVWQDPYAVGGPGIPGPLVDPSNFHAFVYSGRGLYEECGLGAGLMDYRFDDDNGASAAGTNDQDDEGDADDDI